MTHERVTALILAHLDRYPEAGIADVYKLLHQATFGPGHLIPSKKIAREWLEQDLARVVPRRDEPLVENIHPDGAIVRVHLRPYVAAGGRLKPLVDAFARSAEQVQGDPAVMAQRWAWFEQLCCTGQVCGDRYQQREAVLFGEVRQRENWPAVHHTPIFFEIYHPAYRVLTRSEAAELCERLGVPCEPI